MNTATFFLSAVTDEFGSLREPVKVQLDRPGVRVEIQETFLPYGEMTLLMLDDYLQQCDAVIHLAGRMTGAPASRPNREAILEKYQDLPTRLGVETSFVEEWSYTQWEAWLAAYHGKILHIAPTTAGMLADKPETDPAAAATQQEAQERHLAGLRRLGHHPSDKLAFGSADQLVIRLLRALHGLLPTVSVPISPELPPSLGNLFKGRDNKLAEIRSAFETSRPRGSVDCRPVAIWGPGGMGKTRLATEYAHTFAAEHSALLFLSAGTREDLEDGLANLCGALRLHAAETPEREARLRAAFEWLDDPGHQNWFLIVDNVDDEAALAAVDERLRTLHRGRVILTGRLRDWPEYVADLHLEVLSREHATEFLLDYTEGRRVPEPGERPEADRARASELAGELDGLALALTQAAYAIRKRCLSFSDYLGEWQCRREDLLDDPWFDPRRTGYPRTVAVTWQTSYDQLPPLSAFLFDALCWLGSEPVPERLISGKWPEEALRALPPELQETMPAARRADGLIPLYDFCLAEAPTTSRRVFSVHRVIQDVGRRWQGSHADAPAIADARFAFVSALVRQDFVRPDTLENVTLHILPELRETAPHAQALLARSGEPGLARLDRSRFHRVLAEMRSTEGAWEQALAEADAAVAEVRSIPDSTISPESTEVLGEALNVWAASLESQGLYEEALPIAREANELLEKLCAAEPGNLSHQRDLSIALNNVGRIRESQGELRAALEAFLNSRTICEKLSATEPGNLSHQRVLSNAQENVGRIREKQGELEEALEAFVGSRMIREKLCSKEPANLSHQRDLSITLNNMGRIQEKQGRPEEALEAFLGSRTIREKLCSKEPVNLSHQRDLSIAFNNVGRIRESQSELGAALEAFLGSRTIREKLCAKEPENLSHQRDLSIALNNEGRIRESQGEPRQALEVFRSSRTICETLCAKEPGNLSLLRDLSIAQENVGRIREKQGALEEALEAFVGSRAICEKLCGKEPGNLSHQRELYIACYYCGRVCNKLGGDHRNEAVRFLTQARDLARALVDQGWTYAGVSADLETIEAELTAWK